MVIINFIIKCFSLKTFIINNVNSFTYDKKKMKIIHL